MTRKPNTNIWHSWDRLAWHAVNLLTAILLGVSIGIAILALSTLTFNCEQFGWSNFEGSCGYGFLLFFAIPGGSLSTIVLFVLLSINTKRATGDGREQTGSIPKLLLLTWISSFVLCICGVVVGATVLITPLAGLFVWTSAKISTLRGKTPANALLVLIPYLGFFAVAWVLFATDMRTLWTRSRSV